MTNADSFLLDWLFLVYILTYETSLFEKLEKMGHTDIYIGPTNLVSLPETKKGNKLGLVENLFKWLNGLLELITLFFNNILDS